MSHLIRRSRFLAVATLATLLAGCAAQDIQHLQQARDQTVAGLQQAQSAHDQIQQQITTLPADDPVRKQLEPQLAKLDQIITKAQSFLPVLDAGIKSAQTGQLDPSLQQAVSVIPYGSLALAAVGVIFGVIKHVQAGNLVDQNDQTQKAFQQVVSALDTIVPNPTPEQQTKVDAVLDTDVKAKVAAARTS
jgi:hypothetical protein